MWTVTGPPLNERLLLQTIISCFAYHGRLKLVNKPTVNLENMMSKQSVKATLTTAQIEEQTAAFLKSGGAVEYVGKGKSGQFASPDSKQVKLKAR
jgi:hypothetical protein